jgi:predicted Zn-dependent peptidase
MIKLTTLKNGIRIVSEEMNHVQTVAFGVFFRTGSIDEPPELYGASHFVEHMMFKGTPRFTAKDIAEGFDRLGGSVNAYTSRDHTCYYFKTTADTFLPASDILFDMLNASLFEEKEIEKERQVILEEIKMMEDQPDDLSMEHCTRLVFAGDPLEHDVAGNPEALAGQTGEKLKEYIRKEYTCDSVVIAIAGGFDLDQVIHLVEKKMGGFGPKKTKDLGPLVPYQPGQVSVVKEIEQTNLCIGTRFITLDSEDYYAAAFLNNILGGSMSSRLFQNIREEKGLAYTVMSMPQIMSRSGLLLVYAGIAHDKLRECIHAIVEELDNLGKHGISKEELLKAKNQGKSSIVFSMERTHSRMMSIGRNLLLMNRVIEQEELIEKIEKVTLEDVNRLGKEIQDIHQYSFAVVSPNTFKL